MEEWAGGGFRSDYWEHREVDGCHSINSWSWQNCCGPFIFDKCESVVVLCVNRTLTWMPLQPLQTCNIHYLSPADIFSSSANGATVFNLFQEVSEQFPLLLSCFSISVSPNFILGIIMFLLLTSLFQNQPTCCELVGVSVWETFS